MSGLKKILILIVIIFVIGIILRLTLVKTRTKIVMEKAALPVEVMPAKRADVVRTCMVIGSIVADKTVQVFPETMGKVIEILSKEGSYVKKGDRILKIRNEAIGFEYEDAYVTAPINGTIAKVLVDVGSTVAPQMPLAMLVDISRIKVSFNVPEADAQCFKTNTRITVFVDALPGKEFNGWITEISPVVDPLTKTVGVKAIIEKDGAGLKPGMTARVLLKLGEKKNVIAINNDALVDNSVFVVKNDSTTERRNIKIGLRGDELVEIEDGLNENELVVVLGQQRLAGGEKVNPIVRAR